MLLDEIVCIWSRVWDIHTGSFPIVDFPAKEKQKNEYMRFLAWPLQVVQILHAEYLPRLYL